MHHIQAVLTSIRTYRVLRFALAAAFLAAGVIKLGDVRAFKLTIKAFAILPTEAVDIAAVVLPVLEIAGGVLLVFDLPGGLTIIGGLLVVFCAVVINAIRQGLDIDCGCYGPGDPEGEVYHGLWTTLWRDALMLAGVGYCLVWRRLPRSRINPQPPVRSPSCAQ